MKWKDIMPENNTTFKAQKNQTTQEKLSKVAIYKRTSKRSTHIYARNFNNKIRTDYQEPK